MLPRRAIARLSLDSIAGLWQKLLPSGWRKAVQQAGFDVILSETYAPTPAFSWAAHSQNALGALVITASHNPGDYLGLKVKGNFGGSVPPEMTQKIEARLGETLAARQSGTLTTFDPWESYCQELRGKVDLSSIQTAIVSGKLTVFFRCDARCI